MTQDYYGTKRVTAWREERDGKPGYAVLYRDGYRSWSPASEFDYLPHIDSQTDLQANDWQIVGTACEPPARKTNFPILVLPPDTLMSTVPILNEVANERIRQDARWGGPAHDDTNTPDDWLDLITERTNLWPTEITNPSAEYRRALVEIMALVCAALESHDRLTPATALAV